MVPEFEELGFREKFLAMVTLIPVQYTLHPRTERRAFLPTSPSQTACARQNLRERGEKLSPHRIHLSRPLSQASVALGPGCCAGHYGRPSGRTRQVEAAGRPVQLELKEMFARLAADKEGRVLECQRDLPVTQTLC